MKSKETVGETWKIPMADPFIGEEEARAVYDVVLSGWLSAGPKVPQFERAFAELVGVRHAVSFCNGTVALHAILLAMGIGPGDEVIVPDITFISTATSIMHTGASPVFADVDMGTLNIDPQSIKRCITPRTRAVIPVHYAGQAADMEPILEIGKRYGLAIIEDAAEAHGAEYRKRNVGSLGRAGMFSFTPNKNITTGEGGIVTTNDEELDNRLRMFRNHGSRTTYEYEMVGYNYRMTEMQAAIGIEQLKKLTRILDRKRQLAGLLSAIIKRIRGLEPPASLEDRTHTYQMYTIRVNAKATGVSRDQLSDRLAEQGIQTRVCFPPLHLQSIFRKYAVTNEDLSNSDRLGGEILSLPINSRLTNEEVAYMGESLAAATSSAIKL